VGGTVLTILSELELLPNRESLRDVFGMGEDVLGGEGGGSIEIIDTRPATRDIRFWDSRRRVPCLAGDCGCIGDDDGSCLGDGGVPGLEECVGESTKG